MQILIWPLLSRGHLSPGPGRLQAWTGISPFRCSSLLPWLKLGGVYKGGGDLPACEVGGGFPSRCRAIKGRNDPKTLLLSKPSLCNPIAFWG